MTYCVGLYLEEGLVFLSDTRTNAGVDHVSVFSKMQVVEHPGERVLVMLSAGNLAITQAVWNRLQEGVWLQHERHTLSTSPSLFHAAQLVGQAVRDVFQADGAALQSQGVGFEISLLLGGQIAGGPTRLYLIYSAGNFIEATTDTPFLQIGEIKYGKPILDRSVGYATTTMADAVKLVLVSMDSTIRSNLTVGLPLDLLLYRTDSLHVGLQKRIAEDEPYWQSAREGWSRALREAYTAMPPPDWLPPGV
jgi:putative proteasome-type protease